MSLKNNGLALAIVVVLGLLSACGPVKFSASSRSDDVDQTGGQPTPTPSPSPSPTPTPTPTPGALRDVHYNNTVAYKDYKLDIILVIDDSYSMLADNRKLAEKLSGFVTKLQNSNIDWQMCATVTRDIKIQTNDGIKKFWGASKYWQNSTTPSSTLGMVLKKGTPDLPNIFAKTIDYIGAGWEDSDDERGIKAAYHHVYNGDLRYPADNNGCYRSDSAITYIIISDEDERSVGGDASQKFYADELKPLENEDKPDVFVAYVKQILGDTRRFTVNSIIVKPGDSVCKAAQDAGGAKSHYGFKYAELSNLTGGGVGSICAGDYSTNLDLFFGRIQDSLSSVPLECAPYRGAVAVTITPSAGVIQSRVEGQSLVFDTPVPSGRTIDIRYQCEDSRGPSSINGATPMAQEGFFARIWSFFKNLF